MMFSAWLSVCSATNLTQAPKNSFNLNQYDPGWDWAHCKEGGVSQTNYKNTFSMYIKY